MKLKRFMTKEILDTQILNFLNDNNLNFVDYSYTENYNHFTLKFSAYLKTNDFEELIKFKIKIDDGQLFVDTQASKKALSVMNTTEIKLNNQLICLAEQITFADCEKLVA